MINTFEFNDIEKEVIVSNSIIKLEGILGAPQQPKGVIIFAHGSGSSKYSPRNNKVARVLQKANFATLLIDLLSEREAMDRKNVFDMELLADRLQLCKNWLLEQSDFQTAKFGYFGASTGAGAALISTAKDPSHVFAVVSRGGRPDLAGLFLTKIQVPTLLIVGGNDDIVIDLNLEALNQLQCEKKMEIIPEATHLFEEPGALEEVADLAAKWFLKYC